MLTRDIDLGAERNVEALQENTARPAAACFPHSVCLGFTFAEETAY